MINRFNTVTFRMKSSEPERVKGCSGFTLLEVMVAVSILAIAFVALFGSQSRSLSYATETLFNTRAPMLASLKFAELEAGIISSGESSGDFGDDFPGYIWELSVEDATLADLGFFIDQDVPLQKILLKVSWSETSYSHSLVYYGRIKE